MTKRPERSPREFLGAIFETVLEEAERNPDFMARLAGRLEGDLTVVGPGRARRAATPPPEALMALDLVAEREALGQIGLREKVAGFTNAELAAFIRARKLDDAPVSKLNKTQLINIVVRASKG